MWTKRDLLGCQPPRILRPSAVGVEEGDAAEKIDLGQGIVDPDENAEFGQSQQPGRPRGVLAAWAGRQAEDSFVGRQRLGGLSR